MSWKDKFPKENRYFETDNGILYCGDCLEIVKNFPEKYIDCIITSPPYWALRDYHIDGQIGLESTFQEYLEKLWNIFNEIYGILKPTGTCWVVMGDTYSKSGKGAGYKGRSKHIWSFDRKPKIKENLPPKCLCMIPERFAIGMVEHGWILRNQIIWHKPNAMPQSARDRFTVDFEKIFFFVKQKNYYFKQQLEPYTTPLNRWGGMKLNPKEKSTWDDETGQKTYRERNVRPNPNGRNKRTVWSINTKPFKDAHFAVFPPEIPEICIKAGCPENNIVLDPFIGSGTVAVIAEKLNRKWVGVEISPEYCKMIQKRIKGGNNER